MNPAPRNRVLKPAARYQRTIRYLSVLGALGVGAAMLTACDASPYAAVIGDQEVSVNQLNHQLAEFASNRSFVTFFNQSQVEQAQQEQQQGQTAAQAITVSGDGGSGTYSSGFADQILDIDIETDAVHQYLAAKRTPSTTDETIAARAFFEASTGFQFSAFPTDVQNTLVEEYADYGALTSPPTSVSSLQQTYGSIQSYLFSSVCVNEASEFSAQAAQQVVAAGTFTGSQFCYSQQQVEGLPAPVQKAIFGLTTDGQLSGVIDTSYGYEVLQLVSRQTPGLSPGVAQVLTAVTVAQPPDLQSIVTGAHVKVNPAYGSYANSSGSVTPPQFPGS